MLKCQCGAELELRIGYTGADWDTEAGEGSGFGHVISLACPTVRYLSAYHKCFHVFSEYLHCAVNHPEHLREHYTHIGPRLQIFFTLFYDIFQQF